VTLPLDWLAQNLADWSERLSLHLNAPRLLYQLDKLRASIEWLDSIAVGSPRPVDGPCVLRLPSSYSLPAAKLLIDQPSTSLPAAKHPGRSTFDR
jgi:hypothetical protein